MFTHIGCSLVELNVEQQVTARTNAEAKRNPIIENSEMGTQGSLIGWVSGKLDNNSEKDSKSY